MKKWIIRKMQTDDIEFVTSTWLNHYRHSKFAEFIGDKVYFSNHNNLILSCLNNCQCILAVDPEVPTLILGYAVFQIFPDDETRPDILHWIYTKNIFRDSGVAGSLIDEMRERNQGKKIIVTTHYCKKKSLNQLMAVLSDYENVFFNPYIFLTADF